MGNENLEKALKHELQVLDKKLQKTETLRLAGWIGSMVSAALVLTTMADHLLVIATITVGAAILNIMATRLVSGKKCKSLTNRLGQ